VSVVSAERAADYGCGDCTKMVQSGDNFCHWLFVG
jgi:hypothetical protein